MYAFSVLESLICSLAVVELVGKEVVVVIVAVFIVRRQRDGLILVVFRWRSLFFTRVFVVSVLFAIVS